MTIMLVIESCLILLLLWALLAGQPQAQASMIAENAALHATVHALPAPTRAPPMACPYGTRSVPCLP